MLINKYKSVLKNVMNAVLLLFLFLMQFSFSTAREQTCKERLPQSINSYQPAILPVLTIDGKILFFDRKLHPENTAGIKDLDDIWFSVFKDESSFGTPKNLGREYNTTGSDVVFSITPDGVALIYGTKKGLQEGFSLAELSGTDFKHFVPIKIEDYYNRAKNFFAHLSADKRVLLLAIERDDGKGALDLYVSFRKGDKYEFGRPLNLGDVVNTKGVEGSPFLAYDNRTLYFSSNGREGFGGKDLYMTRRLDDSWTNWSEPINLGKPINTERDDNGIWLTALGDTAVITSWDKETMRQGIYVACLPDSLQPEPYVIVRGKIVARGVRLTDFESIKIEVSYDVSDEKDYYKARYEGKFYFVLPGNRFAPVLISKKGYEEFGFAVSSYKLRHTKFVDYSVVLNKKQSKNVNIGTIYFDYDSCSLNAEALKQLEKVSDKIVIPEETQLYVIGHTDAKGSEEYNLELSKCRAEAVKDYLMKLGMKSGNIIVLYKGEQQPVSENDAENRRVEVILIDN